MLKLALDLGLLDNDLALSRGEYLLAERFRPQIHAAFGQSIALGYFGRPPAHYVGTARVAGIVLGPTDDTVRVLLDAVAVFSQDVKASIARPGPDVPFCWRPAAEAELLDAASPEPPPLARVDERPTTFEDYVRINNQVIEAYNSRCVFTGKRPADLHIVPIRPLRHGGRLHTTNLLPMTWLARQEFEAGHITIDTNYRFVTDLSRVDPEFLEQLRPLGKLRLPRNRLFISDQANLAFHAANVFGVRRDGI